MRKFIKEKVGITCDKLAELSQKTIYEIPELKYIQCDYKSGKEIPVPDDSWKTLKRGEYVPGKDCHFWFYTEYTTPSAEKDEQIIFELRTSTKGPWDTQNPQVILYLNDEMTNGLDINHRTSVLKPNTKYKILMYFYTGIFDMRVDIFADIKVINLPVKKLYYDMRVPCDAAMCYDDTDYAYIRTMKHLERACNMIDFSGNKNFADCVKAADDYLQKEYYEKECGCSDAVVSLIGHTHIDVAWLWTLDQTREKVQRSFATVLSLMERYPEYVFMSSQPQLYQYLKEEAPELYEKVKEKVKEGRWEVEGAMWLEADCNLSSGESLVRQILHGKRFMRNEFGVDSHVLWLPDVFGYSAALPQILQKSGVDKFVTSKISWNEYNKLPYDSFMWEGLDGTEVFTYFLTARNHEKYCERDTETTYTGHVTPKMVLGTWERYQQKDYSDETIITFGFGDGGGGPTEEMLEAARRLEYGLPGIPKTQMSFAGDFLKRVKDNFDKNCEITGRTPKWVGELYLEFHRGTYTSIARNKKNNRECEFLCQTTETLAVANDILNGRAYPEEKLEKAWKTLLLNQFHDIIPGSSIREVYEESDREYDELRRVIGEEKKSELEEIARSVSEKGLLVYNPNSFEASGLVENGGEYVYAENIPPMGWKVVEPKKAEGIVTVSDKCIESEHYKILFDDNMNIVSLFDKDFGREVVAEGKRANQLQAFEDYPRAYDNWEITDYYQDKMQTVNNVESVKPINGSGSGGFEVVRKFGNSLITQEILVYAKSRRIDFKTKLDWHENHILLKAAFPTNIHTNKATYDVQFGNVERNTHQNTCWDAAKFEVCAQKWGDVSDGGYGFSLLNNCKYGYNAVGGEIKLTLHKCGTYPNTDADQGVHPFTYSALPHDGDFRDGKTIEEAYLLNRPFETAAAEGSGKLAPSFSLVSCDCPNIVIETVKKAEDGNGIIIRLYDAWDKKSNPTVKLGFDAAKISLCDMMENSVSEIGVGKEVSIPVSNFEIITLKAEL